MTTTNRRRSVGLGGVALMMLLMLAAIGLGIALWSKVLQIDGTIATGDVNGAFLEAFTDDDNKQDDPALDFHDTGSCPLPPGAETSCDPKETGAEDEANLDHRYDKDVAECFGEVITEDQEPQPGSQEATLLLVNVYPSYHCTAWFTIVNNGSIPIHLHSVSLLGKPATPCGAAVPPTPYDLNGDGAPDLEICVSGITDLDLNCQPNQPTCEEFQLDPDAEFQMDLDIHVMQTAPQGTSLEFNAEVCWHQYNEEIGLCPGGDTIVDADGTASRFSAAGTCGDPADPAAIEVAVGDPLTSWPALGGVGIDMFDEDLNGEWTLCLDDLHAEDPSACPTAIRQGLHDLGQDCKILDQNDDLADDEPVDCDLETHLVKPSGLGDGVACPTNLKFHDADGSGNYNDGEDIVVDANGNGIFD